MTTDLIIGLDVSTAITGYAVLRPDGSLLELDYIDTTKKKTLWEVADEIRHRISKLNLNRSYAHLFVEQSLSRFKRGRSSAHTLSQLAKINGIVSYMARTAFCIEPEYIQATSARKICGVKVTKPQTPAEKKNTKFVKKQVFDQMLAMQTDLSKLTWHLTRPSKVNPKGRLQDCCFDMIDAYVIARAGWLSRANNAGVV